MRICDSEENRRKLAWLVPGYILLAWFFCVVFQPLGLNSAPGQGNNNDLNDESLYEIINLQDDPQWAARCQGGRRQTITLGQGRASGLILRLTNKQFYRYDEWNCSIEVVAGPGMDGVTGVVEHIDLRQEETGHWDKGACPDYLDVRTEGSVVREEMCGQWDVQRDQRLVMAGRERNIVGYCYEDRSGHSCETKRILVDVAIEHNTSLSDQFPGLRKEDRHGFTLVFTAWRHGDEETGECGEAEMMCPTSDGGAHGDQSHCIWQKMYCDGHQNCGFLTNKDEWGCRLGRDAAWSFGTITVLVTIWVAIVTILMLATVFLLQWNRITFRTPLDMLAETRSVAGGRAGGPGATIPITTTSDRREAGHVMSTTTAADPRTGGMVSIMVMYRPPTGQAGQTPGPPGGEEAKTVDMPPTYDSLFNGGPSGGGGETAAAAPPPPGYNMLTVNLSSSGAEPEPQEASVANSNIQVTVDPEAGPSLVPVSAVISSSEQIVGAGCQTSVTNNIGLEETVTITSSQVEPAKQAELIEIENQEASAFSLINENESRDTSNDQDPLPTSLSSSLLSPVQNPIPCLQNTASNVQQGNVSGY